MFNVQKDKVASEGNAKSMAIYFLIFSAQKIKSAITGDARWNMANNVQVLNVHKDQFAKKEYAFRPMTKPVQIVDALQDQLA